MKIRLWSFPAKSFCDNVDHQILIAKLNHYGICGVSNDQFKLYLYNHNQHASINRYESGLPAINCSVLQGSVLGHLLFLLCINDFNQTIKFCKVHHFADDTNLPCLSNTIKKRNKLVNGDLKHLVNWLNANKISLRPQSINCFVHVSFAIKNEAGRWVEAKQFGFFGKNI